MGELYTKMRLTRLEFQELPGEWRIGNACIFGLSPTRQIRTVPLYVILLRV